MIRLAHGASRSGARIGTGAGRRGRRVEPIGATIRVSPWNHSSSAGLPSMRVPPMFMSSTSLPIVRRESRIRSPTRAVGKVSVHSAPCAGAAGQRQAARRRVQPVLLAGAVVAADLEQQVARDLPAEPIHAPAGQRHQHAQAGQQRLQRRDLDPGAQRGHLTPGPVGARRARPRARSSSGSVTMCPFEQAKRDVQIAAALGVPSDHGRTFGVGLVAVAPLHEREQDRHQLTALVRQAVFLARPAAGLAVLRPLEDPLVDEQGQPLGQEVARALQDAVELLEPRGAVEALADDQQRPLLAQDLQGAGDRAVARLVVGALHRACRLAG